MLFDSFFDKSFLKKLMWALVDHIKLEYFAFHRKFSYEGIITMRSYQFLFFDIYFTCGNRYGYKRQFTTTTSGRILYISVH